MVCRWALSGRSRQVCVFRRFVGVCVQVRVVQDLYLPERQVPVEIGHGCGQRLFCLADGQVTHHPDAGFVCFEPLLEIGNQQFEQVLFVVVELADMRAPRHGEQGLVAGDREGEDALANEIQQQFRRHVGGYVLQCRPVQIGRHPGHKRFRTVLGLRNAGDDESFS